MAIKDKSVREYQMASYSDAVAKRYAHLKTKSTEPSLIEKDPVLRHLKAELARRQKRLLAVTGNVKPKPAAVEKPPKPEEGPKKKHKAKKTAE